MDISGRLLQACVLLRDQQNGDLTEVTVVDNVKLQETQTALPGDLPLLVTGGNGCTPRRPTRRRPRSRSRASRPTWKAAA